MRRVGVTMDGDAGLNMVVIDIGGLAYETSELAVTGPAACKDAR